MMRPFTYGRCRNSSYDLAASFKPSVTRKSSSNRTITTESYSLSRIGLRFVRFPVLVRRMALTWMRSPSCALDVPTGLTEGAALAAVMLGHDRLRDIAHWIVVRPDDPVLA